jgi:transglutaminase-like putative cysteine protease
MPIRDIRHVTTYHYKQPVAFGEHRMMLRPRDDDDQKVIAAEFEITPKPRQLDWTRDSLGNHVATAHFGDDRARDLRFVSTIRLDHAPADFRSADIEDFARSYPFAYAPDDRPGLEPFIAPLSPHPAIDRWSAAFFRDDGSADTHALLGDMTRTIRRTFKHVARPRHRRSLRVWISAFGR